MRQMIASMACDQVKASLHLYNYTLWIEVPRSTPVWNLAWDMKSATVRPTF
jgi:hypothetical protein